MTSLTERWLTIEELVKRREESADRLQTLTRIESDVDAALTDTVLLAEENEDNQVRLARLQVRWILP